MARDTSTEESEDNIEADAPNLPLAGPNSNDNDDDPGEPKYCGTYETFENVKYYTKLAYGGYLYQTGMNLRLQGENNEDWVLKVDSFFHENDEPYFYGTWFYGKEECKSTGASARFFKQRLKRQKESVPEQKRELFFSTHEDQNAMSTVHGRCFVLSKEHWKPEYVDLPFMFYCKHTFNTLSKKFAEADPNIVSDSDPEEWQSFIRETTAKKEGGRVRSKPRVFSPTSSTLEKRVDSKSDLSRTPKASRASEPSKAPEPAKAPEPVDSKSEPNAEDDDSMVELDPSFQQGYQGEQFTWEDLNKEKHSSAKQDSDEPSEAEHSFAATLVKRALQLTDNDSLGKRAHVIGNIKSIFEGIVSAGQRMARRPNEITGRELSSSFDAQYLRAVAMKKV